MTRARWREPREEGVSSVLHDPASRPIQDDSAERVGVNAAALLGLQRHAGNAAVAAMLQSPTRLDPPGLLQRQEEAAEGDAPAEHPMLRVGSTGADVVEAQGKLNQAGATPPLVVDGIFGSKTRAATVALQQSRGLSADGIIGPNTWAALDSGGPVPNNPDECSCQVTDEEADVHEETPDAVLSEPDSGEPAVQALALQRDPQGKKKKSTPVPAKCSADAKACFSISQRRAWLLKSGKVVQVEVSALGGRKGHPTPQGKFTVLNKDKDHHSSKYNDPKTGKPAPMPHYVQFAPAVGFHAGSLSTESHGCVHLSAGDAKTFFDSLGKGDRVDVVP